MNAAPSSCPDNLVARARAGALSAQERGELHRHLSRCEACRVSYAVGLDFDRVLGPQPGDTLLVRRITEAVRKSPSVRPSAPAPSSRPRTRRRVLVYGLVAAALFVSVAGAASPGVRHAIHRLLERVHLVAADPPDDDEATPQSSKEATAPEQVEEAAPEAPSTPPSALPPEPLASVSAPPPASTHRATALPVPSSSSAVPAAKELFAQANARRRAGDDEGARRLYAELQQRYPSSPEAEVSRVSLGRMLLERKRDPAAALDQFDRFMKQSSQAGLTEEALFGRATSLMQLGRADEERQTWRLLLSRFPGSVYADRARARLRILR